MPLAFLSAKLELGGWLEKGLRLSEELMGLSPKYGWKPGSLKEYLALAKSFRLSDSRKLLRGIIFVSGGPNPDRTGDKGDVERSE